MRGEEKEEEEEEGGAYLSQNLETPNLAGGEQVPRGYFLLKIVPNSKQIP